MYPDSMWGMKLRDDIETVELEINLEVPLNWFKGDFRGAVKLVQEMVSRDAEAQLWEYLTVEDERITENAK